MFYERAIRAQQKTRPLGGFSGKGLLLPSTLLVAVRLEAFPAFVFRHLEAALLLEISHGKVGSSRPTCVSASPL
jgi:hypothetical protein